MTRERSAWWGHMKQGRIESGRCTRWGRSVHHTHASAPHATLACIANKNPIAQPYSLPGTNEAYNTGEKNVVGTHDPREKGRSASAQDGAVMCTTPMPKPLTQPSHALPTKPIAQPYLLAAMKEARHVREACCGRHNPEEKGRLAMGGHSYVPCIYAIRPSRNTRMHCRRTPSVQPYSLAAT